MSGLFHSKSNPYRALFFFCFAMLVCFSFASVVAAKDSSDRQFSRKVGKATVEAMNLSNNQKYELALEKLESLLKKKKLSPYERSTISQMRGRAYYNLGEFRFAIEAFENAIKAGGLLDSERNALRITIAQLHISNEDYQRGAELFEQLERDGHTLKQKQVEQVLNAWIQAENYERALPWAERWFETGNPKERKYYDLLDFLYNHLDLKDKRRNLHLVMAEKWPNDSSFQDALNPGDVKTRKSTTGMIPTFSERNYEQPGNFKITVSDRDAQPIVRIPPIMPETATLSGHCDVRFNVTIDGKPIDVKTTNCTDYIFELAAIESVQKWKYNPKIRDGRAMTRIGVETRVKFLVANKVK